MTTPIFVSENDLHTMLRVVNAPDLGDDGEGLPWSTLDALMALIPCDLVAFNGVDSQALRHYLKQCTPTYDPETPGSEEVYWANFWNSYCSYPERTGDFRSIIKITDFYSLRDYHQTPIYTDHFRLLDHEHGMLLCLPDGPGRTLQLIFVRRIGSPDFTERDRALLILLRPHLHAAHQQVLRRRLGIPELTNRQWELLRLVEAGLSNTQIARRLHVADNTVRKHLENIFERLQVLSRTAAVARAFPGRLPP